MRPSVMLQYALPHRLLSRVVHWATRRTWRPWKDFLIRQIGIGRSDHQPFFIHQQR
jgi:phosphatidylserine decarboxylase